MQKLLTYFFSKNISVYAIFDEQTFNDTLTNDIVSLNNWALDFSVSLLAHLQELYPRPDKGTRGIHKPSVGAPHTVGGTDLCSCHQQAH